MEPPIYKYTGEKYVRVLLTFPFIGATIQYSLQKDSLGRVMLPFILYSFICTGVCYAAIRLATFGFISIWSMIPIVAIFWPSAMGFAILADLMKKQWRCENIASK